MSNYMLLVGEAVDRGLIPKGRLSEIWVRHDDWCAMEGGRGPCDCRPWLQIDGQMFRWDDVMGRPE